MKPFLQFSVISKVADHKSKTRADMFISSPEHEVLMVSYCDQSLSVVRRASSTICFKS